MASNPFGLGIGSTVWVFGRGDVPGRKTITSETSRSWVVSDGQKIPKNHALPVFEVQPSFGSAQRYCLTRDAADAMLLERARWKMAEALKTSKDVTRLRAVAVALGIPTGVE